MKKKKVTQALKTSLKEQMYIGRGVKVGCVIFQCTKM